MILCLLLTGNTPSPTGGKLCAICHQDTPLSFKNAAASGHRIPQLSWNSDPQVCLCALAWTWSSFALTRLLWLQNVLTQLQLVLQVWIDRQFFSRAAEDTKGRYWVSCLTNASAKDGSTCQRGSSRPGGPAASPDGHSTGHWWVHLALPFCNCKMLHMKSREIIQVNISL